MSNKLEDRKYYACKYQGVNMRKTIPQWHKFLKTKPIHQHITTAHMYTLINTWDKTGHTIRQCLGIDDRTLVSRLNKNKYEFKHQAEQSLYDMCREYLGRRLI